LVVGLSVVNACLAFLPNPLATDTGSFPIDAIDGYVEARSEEEVVTDQRWITAERD